MNYLNALTYLRVYDIIIENQGGNKNENNN